MAIGYVTTANTFQQWLIATQDLITVANNLTDNIAGTFYANTNLVAGNWLVITDILGSMQYGVLNSTAAFTSMAVTRIGWLT